MKRKMFCKIATPEQLTPGLKQKMWDLYQQTYEHVDQRTFLMDLAGKSHVFLGFDKENFQFAGFSTAHLYHTQYRNQRIGVIFSGDTFFKPEYWGNRALHLAFLRLSLKWKLTNPLTKLYWHLIASGNRTYLIMAKNFPEYYPRFDRPTPKWERGLIDQISSSRFGALYNVLTGNIEVANAKAVLKPFIAPFTKQVKSLPEISFFQDRNPGYEKGNEISCIARIDAKLVMAFCLKNALKVIKRLLTAPVPTPASPEHHGDFSPAKRT